jgi:hypothetical protein
MVKRTFKTLIVPIAAVVMDLSRNVREQTDSAYDLDPLIADIQMRGQQDPATLEKVGDKYYPIKGFRRSAAIAKAAERGLTYAESAPESGKPIDKVVAIVYENLSEKERTELLLDHGQRRGLSRVEFQNALERGFMAGYTDKELVTLLFGLFESLYPPSRKIDEDVSGNKLVGEKLAQARFEYYKGVLQIAKRAYKAPTILRDAYYKKLRGEQNWPTNTELADLLTIHEKEASADGMISREKPGPKFLEKWDAVKKTKEDAANGGTRPKSSAMRNRQQVEDSLKTLESPISKSFQKIQLGDIPVDQLPVLDRMCVKLWDHLTPEDQATITGWMRPAAEVAAPAPAPAPAPEQK